jgi:hypothetical protein
MTKSGDMATSSTSGTGPPIGASVPTSNGTASKLSSSA